jgi:hypothetical protein
MAPTVHGGDGPQRSIDVCELDADQSSEPVAVDGPVSDPSPDGLGGDTGVLGGLADAYKVSSICG